MRNILKVQVTQEWKGKFLKDFLKNEVKLSMRIIKRLAKEKNVYNGKKYIRLDSVLKGNENLIINLDREESQEITPVKMDLDILFEDDSFIAINKPPFMVVHPTKNHQEDTLANGLIYYFRNKGENTIVRLVSRLDMNTSGIVLVAKNQFSHSRMAQSMKDSTVEKVYIALVHGKYDKKEGLIEEPIAVDPQDDLKRCVDSQGQYAATEFKVLRENEDFSLIKFKLLTGRTHQIRVHTSFLGHPIVNDKLYGGEIITENPRQFLHGAMLSFIHPMTEKRITLISDVPKDIHDFLIKENLNHLNIKEEILSNQINP